MFTEERRLVLVERLWRLETDRGLARCSTSVPSAKLKLNSIGSQGSVGSIASFSDLGSRERETSVSTSPVVSGPGNLIWFSTL